MGRLVQRMVAGNAPGRKTIRSRRASARQRSGSGLPSLTVSSLPASSSAAHRSARQRVRLPAPQNRLANWSRTGARVSFRGSLSM